MFGIGTTELILLFFAALIILGPKRLPELVQTLAKGVLHFRRAMNNITDDGGDDDRDEETEDDTGQEGAEPSIPEAGEPIETTEDGLADQEVNAADETVEKSID